jgi:integrase
VKKAPPGRHTDGGGLYLVVSPTGARRWVARLVVRGRRRDFGLGSAETISLAKAREIAAEYREAAWLGQDPRFSVGKKDKAHTFEDVARDYHAKKIMGKGRNGKHKTQWINTLETYAFPKIGHMDVAAIESGDIVGILDPIWESKHTTAGRVKQRIGVVMNWSKVMNYRTKENPVEALNSLYRTDAGKAGHFSAVKWKNAHEVFSKIRKKAEKKERENVGLLALQFVILTAARSGSVRFARWDHLDACQEEWAEYPHWHIPGDLMKTGKDFTIPLPRAVRDMLDAWRPHAPRSPLIFPSPSNPQKPLSDATMRKALQDFAPGATIHGWRSTFRDWIAEGTTGIDPHVAEAALAHSRGKTEAAYHRAAYFEKRIHLMDAWSRYLLTGMDYLGILAEDQWEEKQAFEKWADEQVEKEIQEREGLTPSS